MPEYTYISHKVKKGETLYGISRQYTVEEHKILQANPEIKITPKGKGKYEIANLKEGQILRIPQKKKIGKRGVKAITGNTTPKAGIKEKYRVTEWYPGTPTEMKNPANVKWAVYYKEKGKYILKFKKEIGEFTFHEQAIGKDIKIVGYLYSPELDNDSALSVKVSPNQKPSLTSLTLYDVKKDKPLSQNAKLKLGQILYVVANTTGSVGKKIEFTLLKKEEKQGKTEYKTVTNTTEKVSTKGTATTAFPLNDYKLLVNPIKKHEYKVKAQLEEGNAKKDKPKQQPKKEESIIYKGTIFFKEGWNKFRETYKKMTTSEEPQIQKVSLYIPGGKEKVSYGEILKLKIEGKNLKGQSIEYTVYEDDWPLKDELDSSIVQMKADVQELDIQLTKEMYKKGGTSWLELADGKHEIYVDVKLKGDILAKSTKIIEVDTSTIKMEPIPGNRAVMTGEDKKGDCGQKYCIKKGDKNELIREINIRLAGFGGNVPTDEFTDRTEKMIKQFQRDYMKVPETGRICGNVLKAIDEFSSKYELPSGIWQKRNNNNTNEMLCPCGICTGFGKGRGKGEYNKTAKIEANHKYEYPGIHRSLLWSLKAVLFYLNKTKSSLGYSFKHIESGYRCQDRNIQKGRGSTNHMGKALDLHFNKNGKRASSIKEMEDIRLNIFNKYLGAKWDWKKGQQDIFNLESTSIGATSWVHYDVREFDLVYLKDKYFTKTQAGLNGKSIITLAQELGFKNTCNCLGAIKIAKKKEDVNTTCYCFNKGHRTSSCNGKGITISKEDYEKESERLGVEIAIMEAIAKQESKRSSFWEEGQATILFERHKMWEYLKKDKGKTDKELMKLNKLYPNIVNKDQGGYGKYSEQYTKLEEAKKLDYTTALKACSWGKFQVMGFNYDVSFDSPEDMEKAVNACEYQQFRFFIGYLENTSGLIRAMKNKNWEEIARLYNGNSWRTINPEYANNIKKYYNEFKK